MRALIRQRIRRMRKAAWRVFHFMVDVHFFWWGLHYSFRRAVRAAQDTINY